MGGNPASVVRAGTLGLPLALAFFQHEVFGHDRALVQLALGTVPHRAVMTAIELLGTRVAPMVRAEVTKRTAAPVDSTP